MKSLIFGLFTFALLTAIIFIIIFYSNGLPSEHHESILHQAFMGFLNINDFFTSLLI